jgi:hypothetical protein
MIVSIIINALLAVAVIYLMYRASLHAKAKERLETQEKRQWLLKIALEQACQVPEVDAAELAPLEPEINRLMESAKTDKHAEDKIRQLIMGLYEEKVNAAKAEIKAQKAAPHHETGVNPRSINNK